MLDKIPTGKPAAVEVLLGGKSVVVPAVWECTWVLAWAAVWKLCRPRKG